MRITEFGTVITERLYRKGEFEMIQRNCFRVLILMFCCLFITSMVHATPMVRLEPSPLDVYVGGDLQINVIVDGVTDFDILGLDEVVAFGFDLDYDPSKFTHLDTTVNSSFFLDDSSIFDNTDVAGSVPILIPGPNGNSILLATMSFIALIQGDYNIGITSDVFDPNEGLITVLNPFVDMTMTTTINVAVAPVPEPATFFLCAIGFLGITGFKRYKSYVSLF